MQGHQLATEGLGHAPCTARIKKGAQAAVVLPTPPLRSVTAATPDASGS